MNTAPQQRPVGEIVGDLARETGTLVRQEVQLAAVEMSHKAARVGKDAALVGAGGAIVHAGVLVLLVALVLGLGTLMPLWAAALLVGFVVTTVGYALVQKGMSAMKQIDPMPERTVQTLKENGLWVKEQLSR